MGRGGRYGHRPGLRARAPGRHPPDGFLGRLDPGRSRADWCGDDGQVRRRRSGRRRLPSLARRFRSHHGDAPLVRPGPAPLVAVPRRGRYPVGSGVGGQCPGLRPLDAVGNGVRQPENSRPSLGYAPATINHNLAVLASFYASDAAGQRQAESPVPGAERRRHPHHNPMRAFLHDRRTQLRQNMPRSSPRGLSDTAFNDLFAASATTATGRSLPSTSVRARGRASCWASPRTASTSAAR